MSAGLFRRAAGVSSRVVDGRAVIVVMPRETLHSLNGSGTFLWTAIGPEGQTRDALRDRLAQKYRVDEERAAADVDQFLEQLTQLGALEVASHG